MAETWWDGVTLKVEMAFGETPTAPTAWTDITSDVRDIPFGSAGRRSEFVAFSPSSAQLVLDNASRQYDPDYATGPNFGDLVPMVPCRITATVNLTDVDVFYGYVKGWPQQANRFDATSTVTLLDGSRFHTGYTLPPSAYHQEVVADTPQFYASLQQDLYDNITESALVVGSWSSAAQFASGTIPLDEPNGITAGTNAIAGFESGDIDDPPKAVEFWFDDSDIDLDPVVIATLVPNTSSLGGSPNAATVTGAPTGWQALSDTSDTSYVVLPANAGIVSGGLSTFSLLTGATILRVRFHVRWKGDAGLRAAIIDGGTAFLEVNIPEGGYGSWTTQTSEWLNGEFTQTEINGWTYTAQTVGISDNGEVSRIWVEVAYATQVAVKIRDGGNDDVLGAIISPSTTDTPGWTLPLYSNDADNVIYDDGPITMSYQRNAPNHVIVYGDSTNLTIMVNGKTQRIITLTSQAVSTTTPYYLTVTTTANIRVSHVAVYDTVPTQARIVEHYDAGRNGLAHPYTETTGTRLERALDDGGWPAALRDIDTGTQPCGAYRPQSRPLLEYARELEATEQGMLFTAENGKLTFIDRQTLWTTDTGVVFTDDEAAADVRLAGLVQDGNTVDTVRNIVTVSYDQTGAITRRDETSITDYGPASESVTASPMPSGEAASNMAAYILRAKKDPTTRYTSMTGTVRGQDGNTTRILDLLQRRIGDVVTVERLPVDTTPQVIKKAMIQGYRFRISRQDWVIDFYLSPAVLSSENAPYLTLGDADDGKIGLTDGNLIPA